jgi:hypothetical protein
MERGPGTFQSIHPHYRTSTNPNLLRHAENNLEVNGSASNNDGAVEVVAGAASGLLGAVVCIRFEWSI